VVSDARIMVLDGAVAAIARTDSDGRYLVRNLGAGTCTVVANGYPPAIGQVELADGEAA
jgi:hypothetical protein